MSSSDGKIDEFDEENLRHVPFYEKLIDKLEVYDFNKKGSFMKHYNGLLGRPDMYNKTAQYVCWDKKIFSRKFLTWDLKEGVETDPDRINMKEWSDVDDEIRDSMTLRPIEWGKLFYCITAKLFLFPIPQVSIIFIRFFLIFFRIIDKALVIIMASIGNSLNFLGSYLCRVPFPKFPIGATVGIPILFFNNIIMYIFGILLNLLDLILSMSKLLTRENKSDKLIYQDYGFSYKEIIDIDGNTNEHEVWPEFKDIVYSYLGLVLPIGEINPEFGKKYGNGGLGILILAIMAISAVVIFVGGSSITVAFVGFLMYIFKVIKMLGDFKTEDKGKSSSKEAD